MTHIQKMAPGPPETMASHCPQNIRIPQELHRIDLFAEHLNQDNL